MQRCDFDIKAGCGGRYRATCRRCGRSVVARTSNVIAACRAVGHDARPAMGLGDMVAAGLSAVGVTKERVEAVVGGPCGCTERQQLLNRVGHEWLGMPPGGPR